MKLIETQQENVYERIYSGLGTSIATLRRLATPFLRRGLRFMALPYLYIYGIDWSACDRSKLKVMYDLLYIFFRLKYYPDNYFLCRLWTRGKEEWPYYYGSIYDPYQRYKLEQHIYFRENIVLFENKLVCYELCKAAGFPLPEQFCILYPEDDYRGRLNEILNCEEVEKLIIKPFDGMGGKGIAVVTRRGDISYVRKGNRECALDGFILNHPVVVQKYVRQHQALAAFSSSTNTIRVATLLKKDDSGVIIMGAFVRFGVGNSNVDNLSSGGVAVGVDIETGVIHDNAFDFRGQSFSHHPSSGIEFKGFIIPRWHDVVELATRVQKHFSYHKIFGLDICVTDDGPIIIEINAVQDLVALEMTYGPILTRRDVLDEFKMYDILINDQSRSL